LDLVDDERKDVWDGGPSVVCRPSPPGRRGRWPSIGQIGKKRAGFRGPTLSLTLAQMILDGSKYCEALETMVAFHVFSGTNDAKKKIYPRGRNYTSCH
jgi:hypothetical protein